MTDPRLRISLIKLWPDICAVGLPVWHPRLGTNVFLRADSYFDGDPHVHACSEGGTHQPVEPLHDWYLDLSRPGASDILARRVATAVDITVGLGVAFRYEVDRWVSYGEGVGGRWFWGLRPVPGSEVGYYVPALADLDPTDGACLTWGKNGCLGTPKVVNLVALGVIAQHLFEQEQT